MDGCVSMCAERVQWYVGVVKKTGKEVGHSTLHGKTKLADWWTITLVDGEWAYSTVVGSLAGRQPCSCPLICAAACLLC